MFDFEIHFIFIESWDYGMLTDSYPTSNCFLMSVYNTSVDRLYSTEKRIYTWDRNSFSWYVTSDVGAPELQLNSAEGKYCYIAF